MSLVSKAALRTRVVLGRMAMPTSTLPYLKPAHTSQLLAYTHRYPIGLLAERGIRRHYTARQSNGKNKTQQNKSKRRPQTAQKDNRHHVVVDAAYREETKGMRESLRKELNDVKTLNQLKDLWGHRPTAMSEEFFRSTETRIAFIYHATRVMTGRQEQLRRDPFLTELTRELPHGGKAWAKEAGPVATTAFLRCCLKLQTPDPLPQTTAAARFLAGAVSHRQEPEAWKVLAVYGSTLLELLGGERRSLDGKAVSWHAAAAAGDSEARGVFQALDAIDGVLFQDALSSEAQKVSTPTAMNMTAAEVVEETETDLERLGPNVYAHVVAYAANRGTPQSLKVAISAREDLRAIVSPGSAREALSPLTAASVVGPLTAMNETWTPGSWTIAQTTVRWAGESIADGTRLLAKFNNHRDLVLMHVHLLKANLLTDTLTLAFHQCYRAMAADLDPLSVRLITQTMIRSHHFDAELMQGLLQTNLEMLSHTLSPVEQCHFVLGHALAQSERSPPQAQQLNPEEMSSVALLEKLHLLRAGDQGQVPSSLLYWTLRTAIMPELNTATTSMAELAGGWNETSALPQGNDGNDRAINITAAADKESDRNSLDQHGSSSLTRAFTALHGVQQHVLCDLSKMTPAQLAGVLRAHREAPVEHWVAGIFPRQTDLHMRLFEQYQDIETSVLSRCVSAVQEQASRLKQMIGSSQSTQAVADAMKGSYEILSILRALVLTQEQPPIGYHGETTLSIKINGRDVREIVDETIRMGCVTILTHSPGSQGFDVTLAQATASQLAMLFSVMSRAIMGNLVTTDGGELSSLMERLYNQLERTLGRIISESGRGKTNVDSVQFQYTIQETASAAALIMSLQQTDTIDQDSEGVSEVIPLPPSTLMAPVHQAVTSMVLETQGVPLSVVLPSLEAMSILQQQQRSDTDRHGPQQQQRLSSLNVDRIVTRHEAELRDLVELGHLQKPIAFVSALATLGMERRRWRSLLTDLSLDSFANLRNAPEAALDPNFPDDDPQERFETFRSQALRKLSTVSVIGLLKFVSASHTIRCDSPFLSDVALNVLMPVDLLMLRHRQQVTNSDAWLLSTYTSLLHGMVMLKSRSTVVVDGPPARQTSTIDSGFAGDRPWLSTALELLEEYDQSSETERLGALACAATLGAVLNARTDAIESLRDITRQLGDYCGDFDAMQHQLTVASTLCDLVLAAVNSGQDGHEQSMEKLVVPDRHQSHGFAFLDPFSDGCLSQMEPGPVELQDFWQRTQGFARQHPDALGELDIDVLVLPELGLRVGLASMERKVAVDVVPDRLLVARDRTGLLLPGSLALKRIVLLLRGWSYYPIAASHVTNIGVQEAVKLRHCETEQLQVRELFMGVDLVKDDVSTVSSTMLGGEEVMDEDSVVYTKNPEAH
eukprot:Clim_evm24s108 gene=Clim_evmTU24s108